MLAWMIVFAATLTVITPSAEQMTKMLAQVADPERLRSSDEFRRD